MPDVVDALVEDLAARSQLEWELLIIGDWPTYSASAWPKNRHQPFAPALPPEPWCRQVRAARDEIFTQLQKAGHGPALKAAEERAKVASTNAAVATAGKWTDFEGMPMHVQAAKSVLWFAALYPTLTNRQFQTLWVAYSSVAPYLGEFAETHLPPRTDVPEPKAKGVFHRLFGR
jgi:hypothetical protein